MADMQLISDFLGVGASISEKQLIRDLIMALPERLVTHESKTAPSEKERLLLHAMSPQERFNHSNFIV